VGAAANQETVRVSRNDLAVGEARRTLVRWIGSLDASCHSRCRLGAQIKSGRHGSLVGRDCSTYDRVRRHSLRVMRGLDPRIQDGAPAASRNCRRLGARIKSGRDAGMALG